jgi:phosphoglycolate phosphatase
MAARLLAHVLSHPLAGLKTLRFIGAYRRAQEALRQANRSGGADDQLAEACRQTAAEPQWGAMVVREWMEEKPLDLVGRHMRSDLPAFLESAGRRGVRLAVFSDYPAAAKLSAMGIQHFFQAVCCAQDRDIGTFKPDPRGLRFTLAALGVPAASALYIGDRYEVDAAAASAAGMRAAIISDSPPPASSDSCLHVTSFERLSRVLGF